jgi:DNA polymerase III delta prime subunit
MENLNMNKILNREKQVEIFKDTLRLFNYDKFNISLKKGIYVYGDSGSGKTTFVLNILKELNYDVIKYDAGDIRNTSVIEKITTSNMSDKNIMSIFDKKIFNTKVKKIVIVMDEIDGMNSGDKGGINTLIKLIRPKKTKKQRLEDISINPIICIGNCCIDKKNKELMKVCNTIELNTPSNSQMLEIVNTLLPNLDIKEKELIINFTQGDLKKINNIYNIYKNTSYTLNDNILKTIFQIKSYNIDTKKITQKLFANCYNLYEHNNIINETDRTSIGLLWHENMVDYFENINKQSSIPFYINQLDNICFSDYIDRITFQKQIWQFNEMSSLIKTFKNNKMYHRYIQNNLQNKKKVNIADIRFTKVLTKYSTEYNNSLFIQKMCQKLGMDKKDVLGFFYELKYKYNDENDIIEILNNCEINKLDINRIYRYIDKYLKENAAGLQYKEVEVDENDEIDEDDACDFVC